MKSILFAFNIFPAEQEAFKKKTITTLNLLCCMQVMLWLSTLVQKNLSPLVQFFITGKQSYKKINDCFIFQNL